MIYMRDKRAIIIKNPRLQKIRNVLRDVFYQAASLERRKLYDKRRKLKISDDGVRRTIDDLSPEELNRYRLLQDQENQITDMINRSILKCVACGKGYEDMVYNKAYKAWYCTECYGMERTYAQELQRKRANSKSKPKGHEEKAIENHSKTFL